MNSNKNMVLEDLSKAGEASVITPLLMELDKLRPTTAAGAWS